MQNENVSITTWKNTVFIEAQTCIFLYLPE